MTRHSPDAEQANDMWMRYDTDNDDKTRHLSHDDMMMMDLKQMKIYMIGKKTPPRSRNHRQRLENDIDAHVRNHEQ